ncbi:MAG: Fic family protein [Candidatus Galacturonibacter soehngenii]|nr:Fic family protein [Candidatus Galacturonibacter soehngenii]
MVQSYERILKKKAYFDKKKHLLPQHSMKSFSRAFSIEYAHHSTAIEGNTLTLIETKVVLEDKLSIGGKSLREIYEVINHEKAYDYIQECIKNGQKLNENIVKDIHHKLTENIINGGIYRNEPVYISGAGHKPPAGQEMYYQIKNFYVDLTYMNEKLNPIELAAWTHAEFVRIHPFIDGNGRTSRLLMNYQLISNGFMPVNIRNENKLDYYNTLEAYGVKRDLKPFTEMILELEEKQLDEVCSMIKQQEKSLQKSIDLDLER